MRDVKDLAVVLEAVVMKELDLESTPGPEFWENPEFWQKVARGLLVGGFRMGSFEVTVEAGKVVCRVGSFELDAPEGLTNSAKVYLDGKQVCYPYSVHIGATAERGMIPVTMELHPFRVSLKTPEKPRESMADAWERGFSKGCDVAAAAATGYKPPNPYGKPTTREEKP